MGCSFELGDDFEKCQNLIDEFEELLVNEKTRKMENKEKLNNEQAKEDLKVRIKEVLETINDNLEGEAQIDKLQSLNEKYQTLLADESNIRD